MLLIPCISPPVFRSPSPLKTLHVISISLVLFLLAVYFFLLFQVIDLSPSIDFEVSFPSLLVSCIFCFISLWVAFISSFVLQPYSINFVSILITSVLNCASDMLYISSLFSSFSGVLICYLIWAIFLCLSAPVTL